MIRCCQNSLPTLKHHQRASQNVTIFSQVVPHLHSMAEILCFHYYNLYMFRPTETRIVHAKEIDYIGSSKDLFRKCSHQIGLHHSPQHRTQFRLVCSDFKVFLGKTIIYYSISKCNESLLFQKQIKRPAR